MKIVTVSGRFFAMDRDKRWDRVQRAYETMVEAKSEKTFKTAQEGISDAYANNTTDEFVPPFCVGRL